MADTPISDTDLQALIRVIVDAGDEAHQIQQSGALQVREKGDTSPVTQADELVERKLRAFLTQRFPDAGFIGEESGQNNENAERAFVVDPIDGTRAFLRGFPTWSVLVGLEVAGIPHVGVAYLPAERNLFVGIVGQGATENGCPVRLSSIGDLALATVCHGTALQFAQANATHLLGVVGSRVRDMRGFGDFAGYRAILRGQAEVSFEPSIQHYDVCAPAAIMRAAGGTFCAWNGSPSVRHGTALATNGRLERQILDLVQAS